MMQVLFYTFYDTILDMDNLISLVGYTTLVCYNYNGHALTMQVFQYFHYLNRCLAV